MENDITAPLSRLLSKGSSYEPDVKHYFSDGICIREMTITANSLVVGAKHKTDHITMLLKGTMQIRINDEIKLIKAPYTFEALAGSRKIVFTFDECVVSNVFPTNITNIKEIEEMFSHLHQEKDLICH